MELLNLNSYFSTAFLTSNIMVSLRQLMLSNTFNYTNATECNYENTGWKIQILIESCITVINNGVDNIKSRIIIVKNLQKGEKNNIICKIKIIIFL